MSKMTRRDFLMLLPRWLIAGGLVAVAFRLLHRNNKSGETCSSPNGYCRSCTLNNSCGLPAALSFRQVARRKK